MVLELSTICLNKIAKSGINAFEAQISSQESYAQKREKAIGLFAKTTEINNQCLHQHITSSAPQTNMAASHQVPPTLQKQKLKCKS